MDWSELGIGLEDGRLLDELIFRIKEGRRLEDCEYWMVVKDDIDVELSSFTERAALMEFLEVLDGKEMEGLSVVGMVDEEMKYFWVMSAEAYYLSHKVSGKEVYGIGNISRSVMEHIKAKDRRSEKDVEGLLKVMEKEIGRKEEDIDNILKKVKDRCCGGSCNGEDIRIIKAWKESSEEIEDEKNVEVNFEDIQFKRLSDMLKSYGYK